jgi:hypothetical protein
MITFMIGFVAGVAGLLYVDNFRAVNAFVKGIFTRKPTPST